MNYLSEMLKLPVVDAAGEKIGIVNDLGFQGPGKTPFMISWRKYVERFDDDGVYLKYPATDIRFSYLDLLERSTKQIKLSVSHKTLSELHPADIADIIEKAEKLLRLMGVKEEKAIRNLLGYEEDTAGRIMTN